MKLMLQTWFWGFILFLSLVVFLFSIYLEKLENATFTLMPLSLALIQIFRDEALFQKQKHLKKEEQNFDLAFSSEAAKISVHKQSEFGESYLAKVDDFLSHMFRNGPKEDFLQYATKLTQLRNNYSLWLTDEVEKFLSDFEASIRFIGANESLLKHLPVGENRSKVIDKIYNMMKNIYEEDPEKKEKAQYFHRNEIVFKLKKMIGVHLVFY